MDKKFIGREEELKTLFELWNKTASSFVVCRGRRRIGKSTLIEEFARRSNCRFIEISGLAPDDRMTNQLQIDSFCRQLASQTDIPEVMSDTWQKAFSLLAGSIKDRKKTRLCFR